MYKIEQNLSCLAYGDRIQGSAGSIWEYETIGLIWLGGSIL